MPDARLMMRSMRALKAGLPRLRHPETSRPGAGPVKTRACAPGTPLLTPVIAVRVAWLCAMRQGICRVQGSKARPRARRDFQYGSFEEFLSGTGDRGEARSLVAYCFSVSDDFRFGAAQHALTQAYGVPSRIFFSEVVHVRVRSDAAPIWPAEAVERLGSEEPFAVGDGPGGLRIGHEPFNRGSPGRGDGMERRPVGAGGEQAAAAHGETDYGDVFLFRDGSLVLWGIDPNAEHALLALLETFRPLQSDEASLSSAGEDARSSQDRLASALGRTVVGVSRETLQVTRRDKLSMIHRENV
jgi:hypothetical protein